VNKLSWKFLAVVAVALVVAGCRPASPRLYKAGGTVTHKDTPVEGATVTFLYADNNFASGTTDAAGKYVLSYGARGNGAALGKCSVTVFKPRVVASASPPPEEKDPTKRREVMEEWERKNKERLEKEKSGGAEAPLLPAIYSDTKTTPLSFEVTADEAKNDFPIVLAD